MPVFSCQKFTQPWQCVFKYENSIKLFEFRFSDCSHCVKSFQIRSFFWSVFSRIRTEYGVFSGPYLSVFSPNVGKYRPEKTGYLGTFDAVSKNKIWVKNFEFCFAIHQEHEMVLLVHRLILNIKMFWYLVEGLGFLSLSALGFEELKFFVEKSMLPTSSSCYHYFVMAITIIIIIITISSRHLPAQSDNSNKLWICSKITIKIPENVIENG